MAIILTFIFFLFFVILDLLSQRKKQQPDDLGHEHFQSLSRLIQNFKIHAPSGVFISRGHVWFKNLDSGNIQVGLDDFCPGLLTKVDSIQLRKPGDRVNDGDGMCVLYQGEKKLSFFSPLDGIIKEVNPRILKKPDILCSDPFNHGWIYKVKPSFETSFLSASDRLANHALEWQKEERERLAAFIQEEPEYKEKLEHQLNEGTLGLKGLLDNMNKLSWHRFEENFLR